MEQRMTSTALNDLIDNFSLFYDWEEKYKYLIDIGKTLPFMDDVLKTDSTIVKGCTSRVWLYGSVNDTGIYHFVADSDAHIVRGLIAILIAAFDGQPKQNMMTIDISTIFIQMGLDSHLSPSRRNGFFSMVQRIQGA